MPLAMIRWNHWVVIVLGFWLIISPWVLGFAALDIVVWNNIAVGGFAIIFILWNLAPPNAK